MTILNPDLHRLMLEQHASDRTCPYRANGYIDRKTPIFVIGDFADLHSSLVWQTNKKSWIARGFENFYYERINLSSTGVNEQLLERQDLFNIEFGSGYPRSKAVEFLAHVNVWRTFLKASVDTFAPWRHIIVIAPHHYLSKDIMIESQRFDIMGLTPRYLDTNSRMFGSFMSEAPVEQTDGNSRAFTTAAYIISGQGCATMYKRAKNHHINNHPGAHIAQAILNHEKQVRDHVGLANWNAMDAKNVIINNIADSDILADL